MMKERAENWRANRIGLALYLLLKANDMTSLGTLRAIIFSWSENLFNISVLLYSCVVYSFLHSKHIIYIHRCGYLLPSFLPSIVLSEYEISSLIPNIILSSVGFLVWSSIPNTFRPSNVVCYFLLNIVLFTDIVFFYLIIIFIWYFIIINSCIVFQFKPSVVFYLKQN